MTPIPPLIAITPEGWPGAELLNRCEELLAAGIPAIMLRDKVRTPRELLDCAVPLKRLCEKTDARLFINHSVEVALAVKADGVHLGYSSLPPEIARPLVREKMLLGFSAHNRDEIRRAAEAGCHYATISPVYMPTSKDTSQPPLGVENLEALCGESPIPLIALGGITPEKAGDCFSRGVAGVAAIGAFFSASDPAEAAAGFLRAGRAAKTA